MSHRHECMHPCPSCARHVRSSETTCPFCEASVPGTDHVSATPAIGRVASRAAITFFAASAVAACANTGGPVATYGPPPIDMRPDAGTTTAVEVPDAGKDGAK